MTVLVTGATGFLAGHLIEDLLRHGYAVRGTVRDPGQAGKTAHLTALAAELGGRLELVAAELNSDEGWAEAVAGCTAVLHTASPNPPTVPRDENDLIRPAVDGTLRVLRAAAASGTVRRVVLTGSSLSVTGGHAGPVTRPYTEDDWAVIERTAPYGRSKALAERAAWEFHAGLADENRFELVVLIPGLIVGPLQRPVVTTSIESVQRLLNRAMPAVPRLSWSLVDVRDVATGHRLAMERPEAPGNRYILAGPEVWMEEMAGILAAEFGPRGFRVPTRRLPYWLMWLIARVDPTVRLALGFVGRTEPLSSARARADLGWTLRSPAEMLRDTGQSLIDLGLARPASR
jgi:dihydroflavonol-4-reductase